MPTITVYQESDEAVWIPVAKGKGEGPARAFLPFNGLNGKYTIGFKAAPVQATYFDSLKAIQRAFLADESQVFAVNGGSKTERQWKARWRHENHTGSPLLGPTLGWALVPIEDIEIVSSEELGLALAATSGGLAVIPHRVVQPVLCETPDELEREAARLLQEPLLGKPVGQLAPRRRPSTTEQFVRDAAVVAFVLREAAGKCECCGEEAPFIKRNGLPYLEVHHVRPLADKGPDTTCNAVAVCPNCHRELHHGVGAKELVERLSSHVKRLVLGGITEHA